MEGVSRCALAVSQRMPVLLSRAEAIGLVFRQAATHCQGRFLRFRFYEISRSKCVAP